MDGQAKQLKTAPPQLAQNGKIGRRHWKLWREALSKVLILLATGHAGWDLGWWLPSLHERWLWGCDATTEELFIAKGWHGQFGKPVDVEDCAAPVKLS
jgi:hypothetical protein